MRTDPNAIIVECGARYRLKLSLRSIAELLGLGVTGLFEEFSERPRLNISISQRVPIVTLDGGQRKWAVAEWGFLAPWDKSKRIFNAAGETVAVKPTFRESFTHRRCLIPADGFYEWPNKQPTLIHYSDDRLFCFAGLWLANTMTMITCPPNNFMRPIHHRMPAILATRITAPGSTRNPPGTCCSLSSQTESGKASRRPQFQSWRPTLPF